jgi:hypothetical protein
MEVRPYSQCTGCNECKEEGIRQASSLKKSDGRSPMEEEIKKKKEGRKKKEDK